MTKPELETKFQELFLDANGNVEYDKVKNLDSRIIHRLAGTYNKIYGKRYTNEAFIKKLLDSFKPVPVAAHNTAQTGLELPNKMQDKKCIHNTEMLFDNLYHLPDADYKWTKKGVLVDNSRDFNAMDLWNLYFTTYGKKYNFETKKELGQANLCAFKHQPATCCVAPSGKMLVKNNGNLIEGTDVTGNEPLRLEEIFAFVLKNFLETMPREDLGAFLSNFVNPTIPFSLYMNTMPFKTPDIFVSDSAVLRDNKVTKDGQPLKTIFNPCEEENFVLNKIFYVDVENKVQNRPSDYVSLYSVRFNDTRFTFYYNPNIFSQREKALTIQDYLYLRDILLFTIHGFYPETASQNRPHSTKKKFTVKKDDMFNSNRTILRGYQLITPPIQYVDIVNKTMGDYYYQRK